MQLQAEYEVSLVSYYFSVYKTSYHWNDNDPHNLGLHVTRTVKYLDVTFSKWGNKFQFSTYWDKNSVYDTKHERFF